MEKRKLTREEAHEALKRTYRDADRETRRFMRDMLLMTLTIFVPTVIYWYFFGHTFAPFVAMFFAGFSVYYFGFRVRRKREHESIDRFYDRKEGN